ncbi:hypothetical protein [Nocardia terpenica]|uniref:hypothetical protein n=1 Tax=Nocardia terpenica TaxID=455432 RepID=UPI002FE3F2FB
MFGGVLADNFLIAVAQLERFRTRLARHGPFQAKGGVVRVHIVVCAVGREFVFCG